MKKIMMIALVAFAAASAGALEAVELKEGDNAIQTPAQAVALHAIGTNESGTVTLKTVTALSFEWIETRTVTNIAYATAWSNLTHTVTNEIVTAWRTNAVAVAGTTNTVIATNFVARAVNAMPAVYPYPDLLILTNKVPVAEVYTNIPYQVETSRTVERIATPCQASKIVTNDLVEATLSGGFVSTNLANAVLAPGDFIYATGSAFGGGRVQLILDR